MTAVMIADEVRTRVRLAERMTWERPSSSKPNTASPTICRRSAGAGGRRRMRKPTSKTTKSNSRTKTRTQAIPITKAP